MILAAAVTTSLYLVLLDRHSMKESTSLTIFKAWCVRVEGFC